MTISRRDMIKGTAAAAAAASLPAKILPPDPESRILAPKFFTPAEFALVDEMSDMIIPTDAQSKGARAAACAAYIDSQLAEAFEPPPESGQPKEPKQTERWRTGIAAVEALSREMNGGKTFMQATPEQRLALLMRIAAAEKDPKTDAEKFFKQIKGATINAYYSSKIGIHDDQHYKGNVIQPGEFAGYDAT